MVEDNDQDMPMEDILSSIKNILEEEQNSSQDIAEPAYEEVDDVLELSPDMRMMGEPVEEINLDEELSQIASSDISEAEAKIEEEKEGDTEAETSDVLEMTLGSEDFDSDSFFENVSSIQYGEQNDIVTETIEETMPIVGQEPKHEVGDTASLDTWEDVAPVVDFEPEYVETETETEEIAPEPMADEGFKPNYTMAETAETKEYAEISSDKVEDNAVDASANIISNFAKMFAQEERVVEEPKIEKQPEAITAIGDGSKTIEDVVGSVIRQIIGEEVAANWKDGLDYNNLARQEIQRQTKEWLDNNLPMVVEKIVQQEIERVMAKVGNNQ